MTVLLGEADRHQSVRMGVGHNINTLLRRATKKARMPRLGALGCACGDLHVVVAGVLCVCVCVCIWKLMQCPRCHQHSQCCVGSCLSQLLGMFQGCSWSLRVLIDRACFLKLLTNFLQARQGGTLIRKWNSGQLSAIWVPRMHFLSAVMCQLLSVPFHSFGVTLQNWLLGPAFRASAGWMKSLTLFIRLEWKWV